MHFSSLSFRVPHTWPPAYLAAAPSCEALQPCLFTAASAAACSSSSSVAYFLSAPPSAAVFSAGAAPSPAVSVPSATAVLRIVSRASSLAFPRPAAPPLAVQPAVSLRMGLYIFAVEEKTFFFHKQQRRSLQQHPQWKQLLEQSGKQQVPRLQKLQQQQAQQQCNFNQQHHWLNQQPQCVNTQQQQQLAHQEEQRLLQMHQQWPVRQQHYLKLVQSSSKDVSSPADDIAALFDGRVFVRETPRLPSRHGWPRLKTLRYSRSTEETPATAASKRKEQRAAAAAAAGTPQVLEVKAAAGRGAAEGVDAANAAASDVAATNKEAATTLFKRTSTAETGLPERLCTCSYEEETPLQEHQQKGEQQQYQTLNFHSREQAIFPSSSSSFSSSASADRSESLSTFCLQFPSVGSATALAVPAAAAAAARAGSAAAAAGQVAVQQQRSSSREKGTANRRSSSSSIDERVSSSNSTGSASGGSSIRTWSRDKSRNSGNNRSGNCSRREDTGERSDESSSRTRIQTVTSTLCMQARRYARDGHDRLFMQAIAAAAETAQRPVEVSQALNLLAQTIGKRIRYEEGSSSSSKRFETANKHLLRGEEEEEEQQETAANRGAAAAAAAAAAKAKLVPLLAAKVNNTAALMQPKTFPKQISALVLHTQQQLLQRYRRRQSQQQQHWHEQQPLQHEQQQQRREPRCRKAAKEAVSRAAAAAAVAGGATLAGAGAPGVAGAACLTAGSDASRTQDMPLLLLPYPLLWHLLQLRLPQLLASLSPIAVAALLRASVSLTAAVAEEQEEEQRGEVWGFHIQQQQHKQLLQLFLDHSRSTTSAVSNEMPAAAIQQLTAHATAAAARTQKCDSSNRHGGDSATPTALTSFTAVVTAAPIAAPATAGTAAARISATVPKSGAAAMRVGVSAAVDAAASSAATAAAAGGSIQRMRDVLLLHEQLLLSYEQMQQQQPEERKGEENEKADEEQQERRHAIQNYRAHCLSCTLKSLQQQLLRCVPRVLGTAKPQQISNIAHDMQLLGFLSLGHVRLRSLPPVQLQQGSLLTPASALQQEDTLTLLQQLVHAAAVSLHAFSARDLTVFLSALARALSCWAQQQQQYVGESQEEQVQHRQHFLERYRRYEDAGGEAATNRDVASHLLGILERAGFHMRLLAVLQQRCSSKDLCALTAALPRLWLLKRSSAAAASFPYDTSPAAVAASSSFQPPAVSALPSDPFTASAASATAAGHAAALGSLQRQRHAIAAQLLHQLKEKLQQQQHLPPRQLALLSYDMLRLSCFCGKPEAVHRLLFTLLQMLKQRLKQSEKWQQRLLLLLPQAEKCQKDQTQQQDMHCKQQQQQHMISDGMLLGAQVRAAAEQRQQQQLRKEEQSQVLLLAEKIE